MQHPGNFLIVGATRYGKTSVLRYMAAQRQQQRQNVYALHVKPHDWQQADWRTRSPERFVKALEERQGQGSFFAVIDDSISFQGCWKGEMGLNRVFTDFGEGGVQAVCVAHRYTGIVPPVVRANAVNVILFKQTKKDAEDLAADRVCADLARAPHLSRYQFIMLYGDKVGCFETLESGGVRQINLP